MYLPCTDDTPSHHCKMPANSTKNTTIPLMEKNGKWVDDQCHMFVNHQLTNKTAPCSDGWEFDPNSGYISTVVTDVSKILNGRRYSLSILNDNIVNKVIL